METLIFGFLGQSVMLFKLHKKLWCCCYSSPSKLSQSLERLKRHSSQYFNNVFSFTLIKVEPHVFMLWKHASTYSHLLTPPPPCKILPG